MKFDLDNLHLDSSEYGDHLWCLHCQRAYPKGYFRHLHGLQMCPYEGCDGDTVLDALDWAQVRERHQEYAKTPKLGTVYPM